MASRMITKTKTMDLLLRFFIPLGRHTHIHTRSRTLPYETYHTNTSTPLTHMHRRAPLDLHLIPTTKIIVATVLTRPIR